MTVAPGSLVGFALAFAVVALAVSIVGALAFRCARRRLVAAGPAAERRGAGIALLAPPLLAGATVVAAAVAPFAADHCAVHGHHLHLCLAHGAAWASRPLAVAVVAGLAALIVIAAAGGVAGALRTRRLTRALRRAGTIHRDGDIEVVVAPFARRLAFTAGVVRPRVYVSTAVWARLADDERRALIAHEVAHARGGDVRWGWLIAAASSLGAPRVAAELRRAWHAATERLRDAEAARAVGDQAVVGAAMLAVARVPAAAAPAGAVAATAEADADLAMRIDALLAGGSDGVARSRAITRVALAGFAAAVAALVIWSEPVHHALETLLAVF